MQEFLNMGGYGAYVWSSFGLTAVVLIWNWFDARRVYANAITTAKRRNRSGHGGEA